MTREKMLRFMREICCTLTAAHVVAERSAAIRQHDAEQREEITRLREAVRLYKEASYQPHYSHVDMTGGAGTGCPACIRAGELREQAQQALTQEPT